METDNFIQLPSLKHIVLVKIAATLFNQRDIRSFARNFRYRKPDSISREAWQKVEDRVVKNVSKLKQPTFLKETILDFIKPVGLEILKWIQFHSKDSTGIKLCLPEKLYWTPQGTVDNKMTAEMLVKDESLDITIRYKLACIYCLESVIQKLWKVMKAREKKIILDNRRPWIFSQHPLVEVWTQQFKGKRNVVNNMIRRIFLRPNSLDHSAFIYAISRGNKVAAEYFMEKLTPYERKKLLVTVARSVARVRCGGEFHHYNILTACIFFPGGYSPEEYFSGVLCFLLSKMDKMDQLKVFETNAYEVLRCFLDWPLQSFFVEMATCMWDFLSPLNFVDLLEIIIGKVVDGYRDYNYRKMFAEFWRQSPNYHKEYVIDTFCILSLVHKLLYIEDEDNIKLIFHFVPILEKQKTIHNELGKYICFALIEKDAWELLNCFIWQCISSKSEFAKFKKKFQHNVMCEMNKEKRGRVSCLLKDLSGRFNAIKRTSECNDSQAKKLCGEESQDAKKRKMTKS